MRAPSLDPMPGALRAAATEIARVLRGAGHEAWLVGGAVRDLALGRVPKDVDLATDATPDEIERLFPRAKGVGKSFGTLLVSAHDVVVQLTTYRADFDYADGRRPGRVEFGHSAAEDARRRDFTCNALFLDPIDARLFDPTGGLADLERGVLRAVGDAGARFREDGLRLLRLARFAAVLGLTIEPATWTGALANAASIRGVSEERVLAEILAIASSTGSRAGLRILFELEVLPHALACFDRASAPARRAMLAYLEDPLGEALALALLVAPELGCALPAETEARLERLRLSRELRAAFASLRSERADLVARAPRFEVSRAQLVRLARGSTGRSAVRLLRAESAVRAAAKDVAALARLAQRLDQLTPEQMHPPALLGAADLRAAGIPPGPRWRELLGQAETLQLDLELVDRPQALRWLAARAREGSAGPD